MELIFVAGYFSDSMTLHSNEWFSSFKFTMFLIVRIKIVLKYLKKITAQLAYFYTSGQFRLKLL